MRKHKVYGTMDWTLKKIRKDAAMSIQPNDKYVYVLLTKFSDRASKAIRGLTRSSYTHASIGIDEKYEEFYSIVTKGFRREQFHRFSKERRLETPCRLYKIPQDHHSRGRSDDLLRAGPSEREVRMRRDL